MRKLMPFLIFSFFALLSCDKEDAPDCFKSTGELTTLEVDLPAFEELIVYGRIKLFIEQGEEQKVVIEAGENLIEGVSAEVQDGRLLLKDNNGCNFFRDYNTTTVYVTVLNLTWLQNAGNNTIEGVGPLHFPEIWLRSLNQEKDPEVYTNGDFKLNLFSEDIRITGDNYSNFFLSGETEKFNVYIADGDGRVEAANLEAGTVEIQHRGTNKLIVNPKEVLKGEIRSTGDVISVNRPETVEIETFYTGQLHFQNP